jgi:hypothetical protein
MKDILKILLFYLFYLILYLYDKFFMVIRDLEISLNLSQIVLLRRVVIEYINDIKVE